MACRYCDFYFTVSTHYQDQFTESLLKELKMKAHEHKNRQFETLYLGGGTPSLLSPSNLEKIIATVGSEYRISDTPEISIECNPDDLDTTRLRHFRKLGFNRISIGIQSFREKDLKLMRRSHNAAQAQRAVHAAHEAGFDNITIDLIYGIPGQDPEAWEDNIRRVLELPVNHISAYHLSFEPGTVFDHWKKKGKIAPLTEETSIQMYRRLREKLIRAGYEHYEISNFAKKGWRSRHNQLYWSGETYLGFGPSAHSFDGSKRYWNKASLKQYMHSLQEGKVPGEMEDLTDRERYHDYLITSLRTIEGADPAVILDRFGQKVLDYFLKGASRFLKEGLMRELEGRLSIEPDSWLMADHIMRELFLD